jgi:hypothetical protein
MLIIGYLKFFYLRLFFIYFKLFIFSYIRLFLIIPPLAILNYCNLNYFKSKPSGLFIAKRKNSQEKFATRRRRIMTSYKKLGL